MLICISLNVIAGVCDEKSEVMESSTLKRNHRQMSHGKLASPESQIREAEFSQRNHDLVNTKTLSLFCKYWKIGQNGGQLGVML